LKTTGVAVENFNVAFATGNASLSDPDTTLASGKGDPASLPNQNSILLDASDANLTTVNIKGVGNVSLSETAAVKATLTSMDASGLFNPTSFFELNFDFSGNTKSGFKVQGGSGKDALTASATVAQTIQGNGGADTITLGGAATDLVTLKIAAAADSTFTAFDTVKLFFSGADKLDVSSLGFNGANAITKVAALTGAAPGGDTAGFFGAGANGSQAVFDTATGRLFLDSNHDGNFNIQSDTVILFSTQNAGQTFAGTVGVGKAIAVTDFLF
jgi:hypothetical protein